MTPYEQVQQDVESALKPPCQGTVNRKRCMWPFTFKHGKLWLCRACIAKRQQKAIERKAKKFRDSQTRS